VTTIATSGGLCYCAGPWRESIRVPPRPTERAHIPNEACDKPEPRKPEWLRRASFRRDGLNLR
jgi:hypothetical protein